MQLIATTNSADMQILGLGGQNVIDAAASIGAVLRRSLSSAHANLFAEPERDAGRGVIDWYAEVSGNVTALADLPEAARSAATEELNRLTTDISALADRLMASAEANERRIGEILMLALNIPAPHCIKVSGGQPILVGWGHRAAAAGGGQVAVQGQVRQARMIEPMAILAPPASPFAAATRPRGPAWPLLAVALLLLAPGLYLLNLDLAKLNGARVCRVNPSDIARLQQWREAEAAGTALDARLAALVGQVADARRSCPVPPAPGASKPAPPSGPLTSDGSV